ncbi:hypothetical protein TYRP_022192 [Tyrophagus putrescentiae]|nr:hypothetical protein TYRP_022192 [Tyrophagus putrescentiae]
MARKGKKSHHHHNNKKKKKTTTTGEATPSSASNQSKSNRLFPAELMIDLEGHVERFFADRALFSDHYWARLNALATGHLLGFNSWGRYDVGERRRSVVGLGRQMVAANMLNTVFEKVLGREALSAHCYHLYAVIFCRNCLQPAELTPPTISGDLAKSPEPELRQLAAELRLIEAINYFAPQETAQLIRPLLPLSKKEAANKKKGKKKAASASASASGSSSSSLTWKVTDVEQVLALVNEATKPYRLDLISYRVALQKWVEMILQASLGGGGNEALMITLPTRGSSRTTRTTRTKATWRGYMKRALAGDNRPPKVRPDQRWTTAPPMWTADVQQTGSKGGKQLAETLFSSSSSSSSSSSFAASSSVLSSSSPSSFSSFAASSSVLSSSLPSFSSSSSKDAKKGSTKTSDEKACFSSMKDNQMCEEKAKSEKENVFSHLNDSSSSSSVQLVIKKDPNNSGGGGFVLDPASSSTMIGGGGGGDQEKEEEAMISTSASTSASSSHENSELEKTKVVPSAAAAADAVSSKEEPEPNISTEVFNELSSFVTYVEAMLADLDAKKGSKVSTSKAPAPALPDTTSAALKTLKTLKTLLAAQASKVSPLKVSASAAASPELASVSESFVALLANIKIAMAASVNGFSNTALSTSSSSSAATATAAAATSSSSALSSAKTDPVKKLPSTKTASKDVAAAARQKQKATEKRLGSDKFSKEQVSELFAVLEEVRNTGLLPGISAADQIGCAYRRWRLRQLLKEPEEPKEEKLDQKENLGEEDEDEESEEDSDSEELDANDYEEDSEKEDSEEEDLEEEEEEEKEEEEEENEEEEEDEEEEEEEEKKAKKFNDHLFDAIENRYLAKAEAEGQLNLWSAVFKVLKFADLCEGLSTRREVFEEVATLLAKERAVLAREEGHTERCFTEEEEALLYELLAEIPQTQMELQTTKTKETKENEEEEWKLGVMTWRMCESSDGAIPKNNVVFTFDRTLLKKR